jgi:hypothetical protein
MLFCREYFNMDGCQFQELADMRLMAEQVAVVGEGFMPVPGNIPTPTSSKT